MQTLKPPHWFNSVSSNLDKIAGNLRAHEDLEEGIKAPNAATLEAARQFAKQLCESKYFNLEEPRITVSANGHISLAFGGKGRSLNILFTPKMQFYFMHKEHEDQSGSDDRIAIEIANSYFQV